MHRSSGLTPSRAAFGCGAQGLTPSGPNFPAGAQALQVGPCAIALGFWTRCLRAYPVWAQISSRRPKGRNSVLAPAHSDCGCGAQGFTRFGPKFPAGAQSAEVRASATAGRVAGPPAVLPTVHLAKYCMAQHTTLRVGKWLYIGKSACTAPLAGVVACTHRRRALQHTLRTCDPGPAHATGHDQRMNMWCWLA